MSHLEFHLGLFNQFQQFSCFYHIIGQRLLYKYMFAFSQGQFTNGEMELGRGDHVCCINFIHQQFHVGKPLQSKLFGNRCCGLIIGIVKAYDFCSCNFFPIADVKFAKMPNAEYANL